MANNLPCSTLESGSAHFEDIGIYLCDLELDSKKAKKEESMENAKSGANKEVTKKRESTVKSFGRWRYREHYIYM
jgi:hypothetical protein